jgi:[ribosomal protein S5]-alanine N-acetyltransferase
MDALEFNQTSEAKLPKLPEVLESERLLIKPVALEYAQESFEATDDQVTRYMSFQTPKGVDETIDFVNRSIEKMKNGTDYVVFMFSKQTGELIGGAGIHHLDTKTPEFGIWTKVASHGNKYGLETIKRLKQWADENLDYEYFIYPAFEVNIPSRKIPEAMGAVFSDFYIDNDNQGNPARLARYRIYK